MSSSSSSVWTWLEGGLPSADFQWDGEKTPLASPRVFVPVSIGYVLFVLALDRWLAARKAEKLTAQWFVYLTVAHNAILCVWSVAIFVGSTYEYVSLGLREGVKACFCAVLGEPDGKGMLFWWSYLYFLSKYWELLDTVIMVFRRTPLSFLHVFHHSIVLTMAYLWLEYGLRYHVLGVMFNTFVHIPMYYYFAVSLLGVEVWWKSYLTRLQIVQFVCSFFCALPYFYFDLGAGRGYGGHCSGAVPNIFSWCLNCSFLYLFVQFYKSRYRPQPTGDKKHTKNNDEKDESLSKDVVDKDESKKNNKKKSE